jgi:Icc protein
VRPRVFLKALGSAALLPLLLLAAGPDSFHFALIGDRTGEHVAGVYEQVWKDVAASKPAFVLTPGDTIEGLHDETAASEWQQIETLLKPWSALPLYLTPGNHDIWSEQSEQHFRHYAKHDPHYSFDYGSAHFVVLDNSRSESLSAAEMAFLEEDLKAHQSQRWKFIVSHRPSWIVNALVDDPAFPLQQLVKKYGVQFVLSGHIHQMFHAEMQGVTYISLESAGGHLRASGKYQDGWFFGYTEVDVTPNGVEFTIHELGPPFGEGRTTKLADWGKAGLLIRR